MHSANGFCRYLNIISILIEPGKYTYFFREPVAMAYGFLAMYLDFLRYRVG